MKEQIKSHEAKMQKTLDVLSKELAAGCWAVPKSGATVFGSIVTALFICSLISD